MPSRKLQALGRKAAAIDARPAEEVTSLELFFDLVFVFAITQVTTVVLDQPGVQGVARAVLELAVVWWMYDGFVWVTNGVRPDRVLDRVLLLSAMGGFLLIALAVPRAFGDDGLAFGLAFLFVTLVHATLFLRSGMGSVLRAIIRIAPFNIGGALLVVAAAPVHGWGDWVLWGGAVGVFLSSQAFRRTEGFVVQAGHFVERHGLLMLIAFGESVVSIGISLTGEPVGGRLVAGALLGLAVTAGMWWCYFDGDDARAEQALADAPDRRRPAMALWGFAGTHFVMIFGVVLVAAGVHDLVTDVLHDGHGAGPWLLATGVATYLVGDALWRRALDLGPTGSRMAAAALAVPTAFAGLATIEAVQMALLAGLLAAVCTNEQLAGRRDQPDTVTVTKE